MPDLTRAEVIKLIAEATQPLNLTGVDFTYSNWFGEYFCKGIDLRELDLSGANLSEARLYKASLSGSNLSGSNLSKANLGGVDLSGANLYGVIGYKP